MLCTSALLCLLVCTGCCRWFCNTDEERDKIWYFFPKFQELHQHIVSSGSLFRHLQVQPDEYAFLCALVVFSTGE